MIVFTKRLVLAASQCRDLEQLFYVVGKTRADDVFLHKLGTRTLFFFLSVHLFRDLMTPIKQI